MLLMHALRKGIIFLPVVFNSLSCLYWFCCRYHRDDRSAGLGLGHWQKPIPQVPLPQGLPDPLWPGQPAFPSGHLLHTPHGLRHLLRHLLRGIHGAATTCPGMVTWSLFTSNNNHNNKMHVYKYVPHLLKIHTLSLKKPFDISQPFLFCHSTLCPRDYISVYLPFSV